MQCNVRAEYCSLGLLIESTLFYNPRPPTLRIIKAPIFGLLGLLNQSPNQNPKTMLIRLSLSVLSPQLNLTFCTHPYNHSAIVNSYKGS